MIVVAEPFVIAANVFVTFVPRTYDFAIQEHEIADPSRCRSSTKANPFLPVSKAFVGVI